MVKEAEEEERAKVLTSTFPTIRLPPRPASQHTFPVYIDIIASCNRSIVGARATSSSRGEHTAEHSLVTARHLSIPRHLRDLRFVSTTESLD